MVVIHAVFPLDPDKRDEALERVAELVDRSRAEDGTIEYHAATDVEDPNVLRFFERYEDDAAFEAHTQTDHFESFGESLPDLLDGEPEVYKFDVDSAAALDL